MTSSPTRTPVPDAPEEEELEDEQSCIRTRHEPVPSARRVMSQANAGNRSGSRPRAPMPSQPSGVTEERATRIDRKIRIAQLLLDELPPTAQRARLLRAAIVRRDEVLLDGILERMDERANVDTLAPPAGDPATGVRKRRDED